MADKRIKNELFEWAGTDRVGNKVSGSMEASSLKMARLNLRKQGIRPRKVAKAKSSIFGTRRLRAIDVTLFTRQMATLIESGIPLSQALEGIARGNDHQGIKKLAISLRQHIESGENLTSALRKHPKKFDRLYTGLVSVGERSGTLGTVMKRLADYGEKTASIRRKVRSALMYPMMVMIISAIILVFMLIKIVPEFQSIFASMNVELPWITQQTVNASTFLQNNGFWLLIGLIAAVFLIRFLYRNVHGVRALLDRLLLKLPVYGTLIRQSIYARISRTIAIMFRAGIPMIDILSTIAPATGNVVFEKALIQSRNEIISGRQLEPSMREAKEFPSMMLQMVKTGEETGELDALMDTTAEYYEEEVDGMVNSLSSLIEPLMIVILGVIIGVIVISMYLPIFQLTQSI